LLSACAGERENPLPPASGKTLRIVSSLPFKGASAHQARLISRAIDLAIEENGSTLPGWTLEHLPLDGGDDETGDWSARKEEANARAAGADPSVIAYIGPYASGAAAISLPILNEAGLLQGLPVATWPGLTQEGWAAGEPGRYYPTGVQTMVRLMPPDSAQAIAAASKAHQLGAGTAFIIHDGSDYSLGMAAAFQGAAEKLGINVAARINAESSSEGGWGNAEAPDVVFVAPSNLTVAVTAARRISANPPRISVFSTDVVLSDQLSQEGRQLMEGWYVVFNGDASPGDPARFEDFASRFERRYGEQPSQYAANAFDLTAALLEATRRVGPDRGKIASEVLAGTYEDAISAPLRFDAHGDAAGGHLTLYRLTGGEFVEQEELAVP
jgi:branched-chain amino acid transport system substrate-binding protein